MIVLDDQIGNRFIATPIATWCPGAVISIRDLRPHGQILDPEIPKPLHGLRQPTFITINYRDFFNRQFLHVGYCVICFRREQEEQARVPEFLRAVLRLPASRTKANVWAK